MTFEQASKLYGTVSDGKIALLGPAMETGTLLSAPFTNYHEAEDGEPFDYTMSAAGIDEKGNAYLVTWYITNEPKGLYEDYDHIDFSDNYEVELIEETEDES